MTLRSELAADDGVRSCVYVVDCGDSLSGAARAASAFAEAASVVCRRLVSRMCAGLIGDLFDSSAAWSPGRKGPRWSRPPSRSAGGYLWAWDEVRERYGRVLATGVRDPEFDFGAQLFFWWCGPIGCLVATLSAEHVEYRSAWEGVEGVSSYPWWPGRHPAPAGWRDVSRAMGSVPLSAASVGPLSVPYVGGDEVLGLVRSKRERAERVAYRAVVERLVSGEWLGGPSDPHEAMAWAASAAGREQVAALAAEVERKLPDITDESVKMGRW